MIYELYDLHDCMIDGELNPPETWGFHGPKPRCVRRTAPNGWTNMPATLFASWQNWEEP